MRGVPFPMLGDQSGATGQTCGVYDPAAGVDLRGRLL